MLDSPLMGGLVGAAAGLFAMMNPIGNTAIFLGVTGGLPSSYRLKAALKTCLAVLIILECSIFGAMAILDAFGVSMSAFEVAGGIIVLGIGMKMLHGSENPAHTTPSGTDALASVEAREEEVDGKLVVPLAMPILAGPGSITTVVTVAAANPGLEGRIGAALGTAILVASLFLCFAMSGTLAKVISKQGQEILLRFMGMILVAIAVGMIYHGTGTSVSRFLAKEAPGLVEKSHPGHDTGPAPSARPDSSPDDKGG